MMKKNNCNEIHIKYDFESGCTFIIALNTVNGETGNGGTRMLDYPEVMDGIKDATKLVGAMTKKCIVIGEKYNGGHSGGKGVIIGNPEQKTPAMLRNYGEFVQSLNGKFQTGTDMNIHPEDLVYMREKTDFVDGVPGEGLGNGGEMTAFGIVTAMKVLCDKRYNNPNLKNRKIAVQGLGNVGKQVVKLLVNMEAKVIATDINKENLNKIKKEFNIDVINPDEIYDLECDIFSPNACGGILTEEVIKRLRCDLIVGAANNPLPEGFKSVRQLDRKKIVYAPDFVVNIGGVFIAMCEVQGKDLDYAFEKTEEIVKTRMQQIIKIAEKDRSTLYEAAEKLIEKKLNK